ncbi:MAG: glycosyltransferase [bacterium]|nr:glycosyltransferase [bacterium]
MRILIATNMYPHPERPWFGSFVADQADSLRALGIEVDVASHLGVLSRWNYARGLADLTRRLRRGDYDLIHSHHPYSTLLAWAARGLAGRGRAGRRPPLIQTFHDSEIFHRGTRAFGQDPLRRLKYSLRLKAWALARCDFIIPVHPAMIARVFGRDQIAIPWRIIPMGVDMERFAPGDRRAARRAMGWPEEGAVVFYPCDPRKPEKRADLAEEGFRRFVAGETGAPPPPGVARLVVGGAIPHDRMPEAMRAADVILTPTDYEASPVAVREALATGRPVVSTDVGDVKERFGDLPGVFICDWTADDVARQLARAIAAGACPGGRERLRAQELGLDQVARRVLAVYEDVLTQPTRECP